ncbi:MAG TPA: hypothetical protein VI299_10655 [Polyangiales bacterium]
MREFFQTETSASRHCRREAARLGEAQPAHVLRAVADHADQVLATLPALAKQHDLPISATGAALGALFSEARDKFADLLIDRERSFRGTLLGVRHGLDLARLIHFAITETCDLGLEEFIENWIATRVVLVQNLEDELLWFARHPVEARRSARAPSLRLRRAT